jgi:hypothetical protein
VQSILTLLAVTALSLRVYVRIMLIKDTGADDWTVLVAAVWPSLPIRLLGSSSL